MKILSVFEFVNSKIDDGLIQLNIFEQSDESLCGPAVIKMVLNYYGKDVEESEVAKLCNHTYELGTDDKNMKNAVEKLGFKVFIKNNCDISDIKYWTNQGIPVIVDWFCGVHVKDTSEKYNTNTAVDYGPPNGHSSIVVGLNDKFIYLVDPEIADLRKLYIEDFMRVWFDFRTPYITSYDDMVIRQIFVILPPE